MDRTDVLFKLADEMLIEAENQTARAEEDVVTHLVCHHSRQSLSNYLAGYLIRKQLPVHHPVTMSGLLEQCKSIDARFENVDLSEMHCREKSHDDDYCLDVAQVEACLKAARQARAIVMTDSPAY